MCLPLVHLYTIARVKHIPKPGDIVWLDDINWKLLPVVIRDWLLSGSRGSVVTFQSLILSSITGQKPVFLILSYLFSVCVSRPSISKTILGSPNDMHDYTLSLQPFAQSGR